jgi:hypothetical protein
MPLGARYRALGVREPIAFLRASGQKRDGRKPKRPKVASFMQWHGHSLQMSVPL